ncbi:hypothetical protein EDB84DRAFT_1528328 [Lactarius hengduanensis]|nr:hypothetical protein EDB84DRAFT_1528328 [Lactarius hengduanensis]
MGAARAIGQTIITCLPLFLLLSEKKVKGLAKTRRLARHLVECRVWHWSGKKINIWRSGHYLAQNCQYFQPTREPACCKEQGKELLNR